MKAFLLAILVLFLGLGAWTAISQRTHSQPSNDSGTLRQIAQAINVYYYKEEQLPESLIGLLDFYQIKDHEIIAMAKSPDLQYMKPTEVALKEPAANIEILKYDIREGSYVAYLDGHVAFIEGGS